MDRSHLTELTYGADPEFFVKQRGVYMPAEVTGVKGTKKAPMPLKSGGAVQIDGCALEFNIAPSKTVDEFDQNIEMTLADIRSIVSDDIEFDFRPDVTFTSTAWEKVSPENMELGCEPDYCAYEMKQKTPPAGSDKKPFRTAAGHIHIGFTKADPADQKHIYDCSILAQILDSQVARYESAWSKPNKRKQLYGALGSFRPKSYGMEYRVLGNDWVDKKELRRFVFLLVDKVIKNALNGRYTYPLERSSIDGSNLYHVVAAVYSHGDKNLYEAMLDAILADQLMIPRAHGSWYLEDIRSYLSSGLLQCDRPSYRDYRSPLYLKHEAARKKIR